MKKCHKIAIILLVIFFSSIGNISSAFSAIGFVSSYDNDGVTSTNPQSGEPVPLYQIDTNYIFVAGIAAQAPGVSKSTESTLTIWNSKTNLTFKDRGE